MGFKHCLNLLTDRREEMPETFDEIAKRTLEMYRPTFVEMINDKQVKSYVELEMQKERSRKNRVQFEPIILEWNYKAKGKENEPT